MAVDRDGLRPHEWRTLVQSEDRILRYAFDASPGYVRLQVVELVPTLDCQEVLLDYLEMRAVVARIESARDGAAVRKIILRREPVGD